MSVTSLLTSIETFEGSPTFLDIGSGLAASVNTDVYIEGSQSGGRRIDNASEKGFMAVVSSIDLSGDNIHIKLWINCLHWGQVTALTARFGSGTTAYDNHVFDTDDIPLLTGWIPVWIDISRTPESTGSSGLNEAAGINFGAYINIGDVGGSSQNFLIDEIMYGTSGYKWSGAAGDFDDFRSYEVSNIEGVFLKHFNADFCFARLELSDSSPTTFSDTGFNITFPDQPLVSDTFMGISVDLSDSSTAISLLNGAICSGKPITASKRPDFLVSGSSGTCDLATLLLNGFRTIVLNAACSLTGCAVLNTGAIVADGADCRGTSVIDSIVAADESALTWDVATDLDGLLDNMTFDKGTNAHHAIELGTSSPTTVTLRNPTSVGFNASDSQNDSFFHVKRTTGTVTINIVGGTGNFSYKSAGATVNVVISPVTTKIIVRDPDNLPVENARVLVQAGDDTGDLPYDDTVTISRVDTTATVSHTAHGMANGDKVNIRFADQQEYNGVKTISNVSTNSYDYTVSGSPATPATGTIKATGVVLQGLTDENGEIEASASYSVDQEVRGRVRMSTSSPYYKAIDFTDTIDKDVGLTKLAQFVSDE